jgi:hypothetical protein
MTNIIIIHLPRLIRRIDNGTVAGYASRQGRLTFGEAVFAVEERTCLTGQASNFSFS